MSLINFLKNTPETRKIFGHKELKIIEKQLLGIRLTQSEKNRLSRDIRKKFRFIQEISRHNYDLNLKKGSLIKETIQETIEIIKEHPNFNKVKKIILFGSTVENERTFRSDIDIAVEFDFINPKDTGIFRKEILRYTKDIVDIQVYNHLPKKITSEIDKKGKILFKK